MNSELSAILAITHGANDGEFGGAFGKKFDVA
jgi:hypothetical protein